MAVQLLKTVKQDLEEKAIKQFTSEHSEIFLSHWWIQFQPLRFNVLTQVIIESVTQIVTEKAVIILQTSRIKEVNRSDNNG